jgi:SsrA-binding protein
VAAQKGEGKKADVEKLIVKNRRATFDYEVGDVFEGGLALLGSEVKSLREGRAEIVDAFAAVEGGSVWLKQLTIQPWHFAQSFPHEPRRPRRVLLHKNEIEKIEKALSRDGATVIPLRLYFKNGKAKVELGIAKGKKNYDKRADIADKTASREARAAMARGRKGEA